MVGVFPKSYMHRSEGLYYFKVKVVVEESKFITYVDGDLLFDYAPAAFDPSDIYYIEWRGGVKINNVTVFEQTGPQTR